MATNEHDRANEKPTVKPATPAAKTDAAKTPSAPSSVTAIAEQLPEPVKPKTDADRKAGEAKLATLQKRYDDVAEQTRNAKGDPAKLNPLLAHKGQVTREIDQVKREYGIK